MEATLASAALAAHSVGPWSGGFGWLFLLIPLFWIAVFVLIFAFFGRRMRRWGDGTGAPWAQPARQAEATLGERFAKGDIDEQEYRARLEVLRGNAQPDQKRR